MSTLCLKTFGQLNISYADQPLTNPPARKSQSLLAYLIYHRQRPQAREHLIGMFWGDTTAANARRSLSTALWHIRRCLPDEASIEGDAQTIQFAFDGQVWVDAEAFAAGLDKADDAQMQVAIALYQGEFLADFYDDWIITERYRLQTLYANALSSSMSHAETAGDDQLAVDMALRLITVDPLREDAHRVAMLAYARLGQRNAALTQYQRCRDLIQTELGSEPMAETTALYEAILAGQIGPKQNPLNDHADAALSVKTQNGHQAFDTLTPKSFIGREAEITQLNSYWAQAQTSALGTILVEGEAGVGKTYLIKAFAEHLQIQGAQVLWGGCYEFEKLLPYQSIAEALTSILADPASADLAHLPEWVFSELARLVPELQQRLPVLQQNGSARLDQERTHLFNAVAYLLRTLSAQRPLLIILEDLHWAAESTLQLTHYLARQLINQPVLIVGTFRQEAIDAQHPLISFQQQLNQAGLARQLHVPRLSQAAIEAIIAEMSGLGEQAASLAQRLYQETEGNPFFLFELLKTLFGNGTIQLVNGVWTGVLDATFPLPDSISATILTRVALLNAETKTVLQFAAVIGSTFDFDLLNATWNQGQEETLDALNDLLHHQVIQEDGGSASYHNDYVFTHHKIQEVIYESIPKRHRQHRHLHVAQALETLYSTTIDTMPGEMAFHLLQAQPLDSSLTDKTIQYLLLAGDHARQLYAHQEAIRHYQNARTLQKTAGQPAQIAETLLKLGLTYHNAFDFDQASLSYQAGVDVWEQANQVQTDQAIPQSTHPLRLFWHEDPMLDPMLAQDESSASIIRHLFTGLVEESPNLTIIPGLAQRWEIMKGGQQYRFHLRDAYWTDDIPVTAYDFVYAWQRILNPANESPLASMLYDIRGARAYHQQQTTDACHIGLQAVDSKTLVIDLEGPTSYILHLLAQYVTSPVPRHIVEAYGDRWTSAENIVTNGPFKLKAWKPQEIMVLTRNTDYASQFTGNVACIELHLKRDSSSKLASYKAGDVDVLWLSHLTPAEMSQVLHQHAQETTSGPILATTFLEFNIERPPFSDVRVRQAFVMAIDKAALADALWGSYQTLATGGFIPPGLPGHSPNIGLPYDPSHAKQLLAEAGFPDGQGFPAINWLIKPWTQDLSERLKSQWQQNLGIEIAVSHTGEAEVLNCIDSTISDIALGGWVADYADPDSFLRIWHRGRLDKMDWNSAAYLKLIEEARHMTDHAERLNRYEQADRMLIEQAIIFPLKYGRQHLLIKPWVKQFPTSAVGGIYWKDVIIEPH